MKITKLTAEETKKQRPGRIHWKKIPEMVELVEAVKKLKEGESLIFYHDEWPLRMKPAAFFQSTTRAKERGLADIRLSVRSNEDAGTVTVIRRPR